MTRPKDNPFTLEANSQVIPKDVVNLCNKPCILGFTHDNKTHLVCTLNPLKSIENFYKKLDLPGSLYSKIRQAHTLGSGVSVSVVHVLDTSSIPASDVYDRNRLLMLLLALRRRAACVALREAGVWVRDVYKPPRLLVKVLGKNSLRGAQVTVVNSRKRKLYVQLEFKNKDEAEAYVWAHTLERILIDTRMCEMPYVRSS